MYYWCRCRHFTQIQNPPGIHAVLRTSTLTSRPNYHQPCAGLLLFHPLNWSPCSAHVLPGIYSPNNSQNGSVKHLSAQIPPIAPISKTPYDGLQGFTSSPALGPLTLLIPPELPQPGSLGLECLWSWCLRALLLFFLQIFLKCYPVTELFPSNLIQNWMAPHPSLFSFPALFFS